MSDAPVYLELSDLLEAAQAFLGHAPEVRDYGLLESALARPRATVFGSEAYPTLDEKAAALLLSLVGNHGLVDGYKRLGWVSVRLFYRFNGPRLVCDDLAVIELVMGIAAGEIVDVGTVAETLAGWRAERPG